MSRKTIALLRCARALCYHRNAAIIDITLTSLNSQAVSSSGQKQQRRSFGGGDGGRLGYEASPTSGSPSESLQGKTFLVTGSTAGIGRHTAFLLAQQKATVLIHGRNVQRVRKTIKELRTQCSNPSVFGYVADFSQGAAVTAFAQHVKRDLKQFFGGSLHALANNAGVFNQDFCQTEDGFEETWAVNVLAPWVLVRELLPVMCEGRIVNCSSIALADDIDMENTQSEKGYDREGHAAYNTTKLALNMWSFHLGRLLRDVNHPQLTINCVDPGTVATKLLFAGWGDVSDFALREDEADDEFWALTSSDLEGSSGGYYVNRKQKQSPAASYDEDKQSAVWKLLERQSKAEFGMEQIQAALEHHQHRNGFGSAAAAASHSATAP